MVLILITVPPSEHDFRAALVAEYARLVVRDEALGVALRTAHAMVKDVMRETVELDAQIVSVQNALRAYGIAYDARGVKHGPQLTTPPVRTETNVSPRLERPAKSPSAGRSTAVVHCGVKMAENMVGRWTEARISLIRRDYQTERSTMEIYAECCALPGDKIGSFMAWQNFACANLKLRRPLRGRAFIRAEGEDHDKVLDVAATRTPLRMIRQCGVYMSESLARRWTEARITLIRRDYSTSRPTRDIYEACCALPGDKISSFAVWQNFACMHLKLRRPLVFVPPIRGEVPETSGEVVSDEASPKLPDPLPVELAPMLVTASVTPDPPPDEAPVREIISPKVAFSFTAPAPPRVRSPPPAHVPPPDLGDRGRLAKALALPPPLEEALELPIPADAATIRATAELWGVVYRGEVDLWQVNQTARHRGARPFSLVKDEVPKKKRLKCLRCPTIIFSEGAHDRLCSTCKTLTSVSQYHMR